MADGGGGCRQNDWENGAYCKRDVFAFCAAKSKSKVSKVKINVQSHRKLTVDEKLKSSSPQP